MKKWTKRLWNGVSFSPRVTLSEATMAEKATKAIVTSASMVSVLKSCSNRYSPSHTRNRDVSRISRTFGVASKQTS